MAINHTLLAIIVILVAPFVGGFLFGLDRVITARMQNRIGPPIMQPFYDIIKLFGKQHIACNDFQNVSVAMFLAAIVVSLVMLVLGMDLLVMLFTLALGTIMLILGGFSVKSPYSQIGAQREILQMLAYEPLLVFMVVGTYLITKDFAAASVFHLTQPLLLSLPIFFFTQTIVMAIKMHKSPFDISGSHHAHQELIRGIYTEFSGPQLAIIELAHWYELVLLLGFIYLLYHTNPLIGVALALASYFMIIVLDNITARLTWRWMLKFTWTFGLGLAVLNLAALYALGAGGPK